MPAFLLNEELNTKKNIFGNNNQPDQVNDFYQSSLTAFYKKYCPLFHYLFYPALRNEEPYHGRLRQHIINALEDIGVKSLDSLSDKYINLYIAFRKEILKKLNITLRTLINQSKNKKYSRDSHPYSIPVRKARTVTQIIITAIEDFANIIPSSTKNSDHFLTPEQSYYFYLYNHEYIINCLSSIQQYSMPKLLRKYMHEYPNSKEKDMILLNMQNVANNMLQQQKTYENECLEHNSSKNSNNQKAFEFYNETEDNHIELVRDNLKKYIERYLPETFHPFEIQVYIFETFEQLVFLELFFLMTEHRYIRKCNICSAYFQTNNRKLKYCSKCKSNKYASQSYYQQHKKSSKAYKLFNAEYNRISKKISRESDPEKKKILKEQRTVLRTECNYILSLNKSEDTKFDEVKKIIKEISNKA